MKRWEFFTKQPADFPSKVGDVGTSWDFTMRIWETMETEPWMSEIVGSSS
jgi:hypothetical protein